MDINEYIDIMEENMLRMCVSEHCSRTLPHSCILCLQLLPSELGLHHHLNVISGSNHLASSLKFLGVRWRQRALKDSEEGRV